MFINRKLELKTLNQLYKDNNAILEIIYGKRRVGKTELIKQFLKDKQGIYYLCDKTPIINQLKSISLMIYEATQIEIFKYIENWYELAKAIKRELKDRFIIIIDEFPYLSEVDSSISSIFQKMWDESLKNSRVFLVLMGSSIAMMESETLDYKSPLFGRRTSQMLVQPMDFENSKLFHKNLNEEDFIKFYSILGGVPAYLLKFNSQISLIDNVKQNILSNDAYLNSEVEFVLREEFKSPTTYIEILKAISNGARKLSEISSKTNLLATQLSQYLATLIKLQFIEREVPITEKNPDKSKKGLYKLSDNFFSFWFRFIYPFRSDVEIGRHDRVLKEIKNGFNIYLGSIYEQVAKQKITSIYKSSGVVGRWWSSNEEIDIIYIDEVGSAITFGEAKWTSKPVGLNIYNELVRKAKLVEWGDSDRIEKFIIFSKSGFTKELLDLSKKLKNLKLVS